MFSHIMVGSNDIERSKRFYDAVLGQLGVPEPFRNQAATGHARLFYRHEGNTFCVSEPINGEPARFANGGTIGTAGLRSRSRPACARARARAAACTWPMFATPTATSCARCIARSESALAPMRAPGRSKAP